MIEKRNNHTLIVGIVVGGIVLLIVLYYIYDLLHLLSGAISYI